MRGKLDLGLFCYLAVAFVASEAALARSIEAPPLPLPWALGVGIQIAAAFAVIVLGLRAERRAAARAKEVAVTDIRRDNTDLKARIAEEMAENLLIHRQLAQVQRLQALGYLSAGVAHELNNVLQVVTSAAGLAGWRSDDPATVRRCAAAIEDAVVRGSGIVSRLLPFAGRRATRPEPLEWGPLLTDFARSFAEVFSVATAWGGGAAPALPPVLADRAQLESVLLTLLLSVRDAASADEMAIRLSVAVERVAPGDTAAPSLDAGNYVRVIIWGAACEPAARSRQPAQPFTADLFGDSSALAMAIARDFATQSGGAVTVESGAFGTRISLWLRQVGLAPVVAVPWTTPHERPARAAAPGSRVLVVDDEALVRMTIGEALTDAGHHVCLAEDGASALAHLDSGREVDLLISDLAMPGMDGLVLIEQARRRRPGLRVILLSGHVDATVSLAVSGATEGCFTMLRKPVSRDHLMARVAVMMDATDAQLAEPAGPRPLPAARR